MNVFDLAGDFTKGKKRLYCLIDTFHEEYVLNKERVPKLQWEFLKDDIRYIDNKILSLSILMRNQEEDKIEIERLSDYWVKTKQLIFNEE